MKNKKLESLKEQGISVEIAKSIEVKSDKIPNEIQLFSFDTIRTTKGNYIVNSSSAESIISIFREIGNDIVIDYEHQTLNDTEAPAAGWIKNLYAKDDGIYGTVEWTQKAKDYIKNREYRYLSPVVWTNKDNVAVYLQSVALTNLPATLNAKPLINKNNYKKGDDGMDELLKALGAKTKDDAKTSINALKQNQKLYEDIVKKLKLKTDTKQEELEGVISNLKAAADFTAEIREALDLKDDATYSEIKAHLLALKQKDNINDKLSKEVEKLKEAVKQREVKEIVQKAIESGKVTPAQAEWAEKYASKDMDGFKMYVEKAPKIVPTKSGFSIEDKKEGEVDESTLIIAKQFGLNSEDIKKYSKKEGEV